MAQEKHKPKKLAKMPNGDLIRVSLIKAVISIGEKSLILHSIKGLHQTIQFKSCDERQGFKDKMEALIEGVELITEYEI